MINASSKIYKLGTRDSPLAVWQAKKVQSLLKEKGVDTELVPVKSEGDLDLVTPLYAMGVQGVFTKTLDAWLLSGRIDLAVHSMKDVPVQLAQGLIQAAVPLRACTEDVLVWKGKAKTEEELQAETFIVGTGSVRRAAFWRNRFPKHGTESLRGNVQTRLRKLRESDWIGAIFARAGLERMGLDAEVNVQPLDWMLPAPAQGALMVVCRIDDEELRQLIGQINNTEAELCTGQERAFLERMHGGCSAPVGALARIEDGKMHFEGAVSNIDGTKMLRVQKSLPLSQSEKMGIMCAEALLAQGAEAIIESVRNLK